MPSKKNIETVNEIKKKISEKKAVFIADFTGLRVKDFTELRKKLKTNKISMKVYKNRLFKIALKESAISDAEKYLKGVSTFIFADEEVLPAKLLVDFSKKNGTLKIKGGIIDGEILDKNAIETLSKIPSEEELHTALVLNLSAPIWNFVYIFDALFTNLTLTLETIIKQKEDK